jgi:N-acetylglucosaminyl-diphospho-decaprenol L-rhamnosyltransferase
VEGLAGRPGIEVVVVDNASPDGSLEAIADLPVTGLQLDRNGGFAHGCNAGWRTRKGDFVLFLNPDATIAEDDVRRLASVLDAESRVAAVAPKILHSTGELDFSQRRFPRLRSTYAQAFFLHRIFARALWADETVRRLEEYERQGSPEWVSGACMLVRRRALEELGGLDESFFLYCEDTDLCRRLWDAGHEVRFEPTATAVHEGGASAPRPSLIPVLVSSRVRYASKHRGRLAALLERIGIALGALTHSVVSSGGRAARAGHLRSLRQAALPART